MAEAPLPGGSSELRRDLDSQHSSKGKDGQTREPCLGLLTELCFILRLGKARAFRKTAHQADLMEDGLASARVASADSPIAGLWSTRLNAKKSWVSLCLVRRSQPQH